MINRWIFLLFALFSFGCGSIVCDVDGLCYPEVNHDTGYSELSYSESNDPQEYYKKDHGDFNQGSSSDYSRPNQEKFNQGSDYSRPNQEKFNQGSDYSRPNQERFHQGSDYSRPNQEKFNQGSDYPQPKPGDFFPNLNQEGSNFKIIEKPSSVEEANPSSEDSYINSQEGSLKPNQEKFNQGSDPNYPKTFQEDDYQGIDSFGDDSSPYVPFPWPADEISPDKPSSVDNSLSYMPFPWPADGSSPYVPFPWPADGSSPYVPFPWPADDSSPYVPYPWPAGFITRDQFLSL